MRSAPCLPVCLSLVEPLSERELELLGLIAARQSNQQSDRLVRSLLLLADPGLAKSRGCLYVFACHVLRQEFEHDLILDPKLDDAKLAP
jgi:hypothetical protein